jgi:hypothetical protein
LINNPAVRTADFQADADMYKWVCDYQNGEKHFKATTLLIAEKLDAIMKKYTAIPPCDMLVARVGHNSGEYFAVLYKRFRESSENLRRVAVCVGQGGVCGFNRLGGRVFADKSHGKARHH